MHPKVSEYLTRRAEVPGWFLLPDFLLFDLLLSRDDEGDLLEIGAYQGASAILLGLHLRPGDKFTVCDLFGLSADKAANAKENAEQYADLTRSSFEGHYRDWLPELPDIVQAPSAGLSVAAHSCRFAHIDGSHLYDHVSLDMATARDAANSTGVVVCDDWRREHTPGVTFAVMQEIHEGGLRAFATTGSKLYGCWDVDLASRLAVLVTEFAESDPRIEVALVDRIMGIDLPLIRESAPKATLAQRARRRVATALAP